MRPDRWVQLIAAGVLVICLLVTIVISPSINADRRDLQLSYDAEVGDRVPPKYIVLAASLGSFRGVAANVLWYRAEQLKREGRFFEINTLAQWITWLQPRFPRVWEFQAWNMAYNISVETETPQERYHWVNRGIRLLREDGIPNNPRAVVLYRQLGWIFFHKIGGMTDDMHWYYKTELAREWQEVLGNINEGATPEEALGNFGPIADAAEKYFVLNRPTREMRAILQDILNQLERDPQIKRRAERMLHSNIGRLYRESDDLSQQVIAADRRLESRMRELQAIIEQHNRPKRPLAMLYEDAPAAREIVQRLADVDIELNREGLRRVGRFFMLLDFLGPEQMQQQVEQEPNPQLRTLSQLLINPENREAVAYLLAFWRAKVLLEDYRMDPSYMYLLMERFGPLDWRHPASQAIYWSSMGVEAALNLLDTSGIDILNTERQVIHGMQMMMYTGRVHYDPMTGRLITLPDPRFIPSYETAMRDAAKRYENADLPASGTLQTFEAGHENFLQKAVTYSYLYGDVEQAQQYYEQLRDEYGESSQQQQGGVYRQSLNDFVMNHLRKDVFGESVNTAQFIDAMLTQAFVVGLGNDRSDVFTQYMELAQQVQAEHRRMRGNPNPNAFEGRERLMLGSFDELVNATYAEIMRSPQWDLVERSRIYMNTPLSIRLATYPRFRSAVQQQCERMGVDMSLAFPRPPGLELESDLSDLE